jgi:hypothetical protein
VTEALLSIVRRELAAIGTPARAEGARVYMKSAMPFHGVGAVSFRACVKRIFDARPVPGELQGRHRP